MDELIKLIEEWSKNKRLDKAQPSKQFLKVTEEVGEVAAALARGDQDELKDGIGDVVVTLIILAQQNNTNLQECLSVAYDEIKDRKGELVDGVFVKDSDLRGATREDKWKNEHDTDWHTMNEFYDEEGNLVDSSGYWCKDCDFKRKEKMDSCTKCGSANITFYL